MKMVPAREIHEIELSSVCNLACRYCPHPKLERPKEHMSLDVFERTMWHVRHYVSRGTQGEVSLTGIGEAILNPHFEFMISATRKAIGNRPLVMATNGVALTDELAAICARFGAVVYVSTHRPEKAGPAVERLKKAGASVGINTAFVDSALDWAGQVKWHVSAPSKPCDYLGKAWAVVRQDGSVNACCMDAHGKYRIGHVNDELGSLLVRPIGLCESCNLKVPSSFNEEAA